jgi:hypothetical protein
MKWINTLSDDAQNLLAMERELEPEAEDRRLRALARARAGLRSSDAPRRGIAWRLPARVFAPALVLALATLSYAAWRRTESAIQSPSVEEKAAPPAIKTLPPPPTASPSAATEAPSELGQKAERAPTRKPESPPSSSAASYALELAVLEPARAAVARGDHPAALRAIAAHERRFPTGILREEREALRVKALIGLGKVDDAKRAAERFRDSFPRSVLSPGIQDAVKQTR